MLNLVRLIEEHQSCLLNSLFENITLNESFSDSPELRKLIASSISSLSNALSTLLQEWKSGSDLKIESVFFCAAASDFGLQQTKHFRDNNLAPPVFFSLTKYSRRYYLELFSNTDRSHDHGTYRLFLDKFFDRAEITFCREWARCEETRLSNTRESLADSQNMLQVIMNAIPVGVFWKNLDLNYLGLY